MATIKHNVSFSPLSYDDFGNGRTPPIYTGDVYVHYPSKRTFVFCKSDGDPSETHGLTADVLPDSGHIATLERYWYMYDEDDQYAESVAKISNYLYKKMNWLGIRNPVLYDYIEDTYTLEYSLQENKAMEVKVLPLVKPKEKYTPLQRTQCKKTTGVEVLPSAKPKGKLNSQQRSQFSVPSKLSFTNKVQQMEVCTVENVQVPYLTTIPKFQSEPQFKYAHISTSKSEAQIQLPYVAQLTNRVYNIRQEIAQFKRIANFPRFYSKVQQKALQAKYNELRKCLSKIDSIYSARNITQAKCVEPIVVNSQMNSTPSTTVESGDAVEKASTINVTLVENRPTTEVQPIVDQRDVHSFGLKPAIFPQLTDRYNNLGTFEWTTSHPFGQIIKQILLPNDIFPVLNNNPTTLPFNQYMFVRPQITLRFQLNSTRFHQGKLVIGFRYYNRYSTGIATIVHASQIVQLDYASLIASSSNVVELKIPFQSHLDMLPIHNTNIGSTLYYATVFVGVLSPLRTGPENTNHVTITTQISLSCNNIQTQFFGIRSRKNVVSQMLESKTVQSQESSTLIRNPTISLSYGSGQTNSKVLRLTPPSTTPIVGTNIPIGDKLELNDLIHKWGFIGQFDINVDDLESNLLFSISNAPIQTFNIDTNFNLPTPLGGVANIFSYWQGTIEYKFEIIKAQAHSLRLRFCINPTDSVNSSEAINLISTVYDFEERSEVTIDFPFLAPSKMVPCKIDNNVVAVGTLQVFLESRLISMASLNSSVNVLVYQRASPDFCLSVPRSNQFITNIRDTISFTSIVLSGDWGVDYQLYGSFDSSETANVVFNPISPTIINNFAVPARYIILTKVMQPNIDFSQPFTTNIAAANRLVVPYVNTISIGVYGDGTYISINTDGTLSLVQGTTTTPITVRLYNNSNLVAYQNVIVTEIPTTRIIANSQMNERETSSDKVSEGKTSIPVSEMVLGETFDLISCLRRFQPILSSTVSFSSAGMKRLIFDVNFGAPFLRVNSFSPDNVSFLHDAFRFSKGSLNYLITALAADNSNITVYARHIPAGLFSSFTLTESWEDVTSIAAEMYAHDIPFNKDTAIPITVPFYNYTNFLINHYNPQNSGYSDISAYSMGRLEIYLIASASTTVNFRIERSLGDDANMYVFQGWPVCSNQLTTIQWNSENASARQFPPLPRKILNSQCSSSSVSEMLENLIKDSKDNRNLNIALRKLENKLNIKSQGIFDNIKDKFSKAKDTLFDFVCDVFSSSFAKGMEWSKKLLHNFFNVFIGALSFNRLYMLYTLAKMCFSSTSTWVRVSAFVLLLFDIGVVTSDKTKQTIVMMAEMMFLFSSKTTVVVNSQGIFESFNTIVDNQLIKQDPNVLVRNMLSVILGGVAAVCGFANAPNITSAVGSFIKIYANTTNQYSNMFKSVGSCVVDYVLECLGLNDEGAAAAMKLRAIDADMAKWVDECLYLIEPSRSSEVKSSPKMRARVAKCYESGTIISKSIMSNPDVKFKTTFMYYYKCISELYREVGTVPNSVKANVCPIVIWLSGKPGVGKSQFADHLAKTVLTALSVSYEGNACFTRVPQRKYWDGYEGQPAIIFDDALQVSNSESKAQFYQDWFSIVSNAPFTAEFSNISEKKKFVFPSVVIVCCNAAFPNVDVLDKTAFYRRRDYLVEVDIADEIRTKFPDIKDLNHPGLVIPKGTWDHLSFCFYPSPSIPTATNTLPKTNFVNCNNFLSQLIKTAVPKFYNRCVAADSLVSSSSVLSADVIEVTRDALFKELNIENSIKTLGDKIGLGDFANVFSQGNEVDDIQVCMCNNQKLPIQNFCNTKISAFKTELKFPTGYKCKSIDYCGLHKCLNLNGLIVQKRSCINNKDIIQVAPRLPEEEVNVIQNQFKYDSILVDYRLSVCEDKCDDCVSKWNGACEYGKALYCFSIGATKDFFDNDKTFLDNIFPQMEDFVVAETLCHNEFSLSCRSCLLRSYKSKFEVYNDPWSWIKNHKVAIILVLGSMLAGLAYWYGMFSSPAVKSPSLSDVVLKAGKDGNDPWKALSTAGYIGQMVSSGDVKTARVGTLRQLRVPHSVSSQADVNDLGNRIFRNTVHITVNTNSGSSFDGNALGIVDRYILAPYHYFLFGNDIQSINLQLNGQHEQGGSILLNPSDYKIEKINNSDLCVLKILNRRIPQFKNVTKQMVHSLGVGRISNKAILFEIKGSRVDRTMLDVKQVATTVTYADWVKRIGSAPEFDLFGFEYSRSQSGLCGSVLVDEVSGLIIGMHTCGASKGYSSIVCGDTFDSLELSSVDVVEPPLNAHGGKVSCKGEFIPIGVLDREDHISLPTKTNVISSQCKGVLCPDVRVPVVMTTKGDLFPGEQKLEKALEKGFSPTRTFNLVNIERACSSLKQRLIARAKPIVKPKSQRSIAESVEGLPGVPFFDSMKLNTSPGWPLAARFKGSKKRDFVQVEVIDNEPKLIGLHKDAVSLYNEHHENRLKGIRPFDPYLNFLKDERLKPGKNPRLINGCSLSTTIEFRRYTMDFVAALQSNNYECGVGIGMNVHGYDWTRLANIITERNGLVCCGDYSGFGPGLDPELVLRSGEIIDEWYKVHAEDYKSEDSKVRAMLFEELAFSNEVSVDSVIGTLCGSPSGNPLTVVVNSIVNLLYLILIWLDVFEGTTLDTPVAFWENVTPIVYGDDLIFSVNPNLLNNFNNAVLQENFAKYGITYTDADKSGNIRKFVSINEATFLKCYFRKHDTRGPSFWLAALEKPMIEDMCNWIRKPCPDMQEASLANCREAARLAYAWGREYHSYVCTKLVAFWRELGVDLQLESWDYVDAMCFGELNNSFEHVVGGLFGFTDWSRKRDIFLGSVNSTVNSQAEENKTVVLKSMSGRYDASGFKSVCDPLRSTSLLAASFSLVDDEVVELASPSSFTFSF
nr:MAG: ORF1 [Picornaviridae sp.]